jgi:hypothetical protein
MSRTQGHSAAGRINYHYITARQYWIWRKSNTTERTSRNIYIPVDLFQHSKLFYELCQISRIQLRKFINTETAETECPVPPTLTAWYLTRPEPIFIHLPSPYPTSLKSILMPLTQLLLVFPVDIFQQVFSTITLYAFHVFSYVAAPKILLWSVTKATSTLRQLQLLAVRNYVVIVPAATFHTWSRNSVVVIETRLWAGCPKKLWFDFR